jgi:hypothetical protein
VLALEEVRLRGVERGLILGCAAVLAAFLAWAQATALPEIAAAPREVTTDLAAAPRAASGGRHCRGGSGARGGSGQLFAANADRQRAEGQAATARLALAEAQSRVAEIRSSARDEARHEAARVAQEMAEIEQTIARLQDRLERTPVRAPIGGLVRGLAVQRSGSLAQPGALLAEIVPQDAGLVVEARVAR